MIGDLKLDVLLVKLPERMTDVMAPKPWVAFCLTPIPFNRQHPLGVGFSVGYLELDRLRPVAAYTADEAVEGLRKYVLDMLSMFEEVRSFEVPLNVEATL
jgi:hypothetical protein